MYDSVEIVGIRGDGWRCERVYGGINGDGKIIK